MKNKLVWIAMAFAICLLTGCSPTIKWVERYEPRTDAERNSIAAHVEKIMEATPKTLSGHDQDWDDAIRMATEEAKTIYCRKTLAEWKVAAFFGDWSDNGLTGRWKYADEMEIKNK